MSITKISPQVAIHNIFRTEQRTSLQLEPDKAKEDRVEISSAVAGAGTYTFSRSLLAAIPPESGEITGPEQEQEDIMEERIQEERIAGSSLGIEGPSRNQNNEFSDKAKIMLIATRIMNGDIVPPQDEEYLANREPKLYLTVKALAAIKEKPIEHDSVLEDPVAEDFLGLEQAENTVADVEIADSVEGTDMSAVVASP